MRQFIFWESPTTSNKGNLKNIWSEWRHDEKSEYYCRKPYNGSSLGLEQRTIYTNCKVKLGSFSKTFLFTEGCTYHTTSTFTNYAFKLFQSGETDNGTPILSFGLDVEGKIVCTGTGAQDNNFTWKGSTDIDKFDDINRYEANLPMSDIRFDNQGISHSNFEYLIWQIVSGLQVYWVLMSKQVDAENYSVTITVTIQLATAAQPTVLNNYNYEYKHSYTGVSLARTEQLVNEAKHQAELAMAEANRAANIAQNVKDTFDQIDVNGLISI